MQLQVFTGLNAAQWNVIKEIKFYCFNQDKYYKTLPVGYCKPKTKIMEIPAKTTVTTTLWWVVMKY